ncbi:7545_t:CDS:2 [Gigaspora margarita]|uniref:7545_t:CDS:1 n=1 Tax=Gigaspora margarita TaxID=4874 RepID=A0ABN7UDD0_GIGMA|nr:7545_t:CDS:2 [Gigaspora margarita]
MEDQHSASPYIPLAARIKHFLEKTPDRFKSNLISIKPTAIQMIPPTKPKSPLLRTKLRAKPRKTVNTEEKKIQEPHKINAKQKNVKLGAPSIKKADITVPCTKPLPPARTIPTTRSKPFKLETDVRGEKYQQQLRQELTKMKIRDKENVIFHAKPVPKFSSTQTKKPNKPPTVPVSFVFQTDSRIKERKALEQQRKLRDHNTA